MLNILLIIGIALILLYFLRTDYIRGIAISTFLLIALPDTLSIDLGLPISINAYRVILLMLVLFGANKRNRYENIFSVPFITIISLVAISGLISNIISIDIAHSFNKYFGFTIAIYIYYVIIVRGIDDKDDMDLVLKYMVAGIIMVAVFGLVERYWKFSVVKYLDVDYYYWMLSTLGGRVTSTYPHPILLGAGLAMGVPLMLYMTYYSQDSRVLTRYKVSTLLVIGVAYFTLSRGAWLSIALCLFFSLLLLSKEIKKCVMVYILISIVFLVFNHGIFDTIYALYKETFNVSTLKGRSFSYRGELWRVAFDKISESPVRFLFGYGDGAHNKMEIMDSLSYLKEWVITFDSWDNEYACILLERGILGFGMYVIMILVITYRIIKSGLEIKGARGVLIKSIFISNCVLIFMMTNVKIFATQLAFLFWTNVAMAVRAIDHEKYDLAQ